MTCKDCNKSITPEAGQHAKDSFGVELCQRHTKLVNGIIEEHQTPIEAIQLFYALKEIGANPMLEWWDGHKSIDIEIETDYHLITHEQAINDLEGAMHSFKNGFTTVRPTYSNQILFGRDREKYIGHHTGTKIQLKGDIDISTHFSE